jgi:hypothetical protein
VSKGNNPYDELFIFNLINCSVITYANSPGFTAFEFFAGLGLADNLLRDETIRE